MWWCLFLSFCDYDGVYWCELLCIVVRLFFMSFLSPKRYRLREVGMLLHPQKVKYKLYLPPMSQRLGPHFLFLRSLSCTPAGIAAHQSGLLLHPQRTQCNLYNTYQMQHKLGLPAVVNTVSTRFSTNCVYPCACVTGGSDSSHNAERSG